MDLIVERHSNDKITAQYDGITYYIKDLDIRTEYERIIDIHGYDVHNIVTGYIIQLVTDVNTELVFETGDVKDQHHFEYGKWVYVNAILKQLKAWDR